MTLLFSTPGRHPHFAGYQPAPLPSQNSRIFIGGLKSINGRLITEMFEKFGQMVSIQAKDNGIGWVEFATRKDAEVAICQMQSWPVAEKRVRLSWGRKPFIKKGGKFGTKGNA
ncbi:polyadenylate-binding protein RBP47B [Venturia nashicola]|uniref:Polyadenylate-binding protein RBP47B n=1 Tax=Venturia nashicola TaxID=86259 RepID=A0A4Z1NSS7_9PEZI|nr:polyadenylate-binding protein RBP47B [Venturia nashicola]TLD29786.1 polyadenylate-binding protein RBP47B [Venturia nashicola]